MTRRPWAASMLAAAAMAFMAADARACRYEQDERPLSERLAAAPEAWIGRVLVVGGDWVTFEVDTPLRGSGKPGGLQRREAFTHGSCSLRFEVGQRWLYAGSDAPSASLLLSGVDGLPRAPAHRDDVAAGSASWASGCLGAGSCQAVGHGCAEISWVPAARAEAARARLGSLGGNAVSPGCPSSSGSSPSIRFGVCQSDSCVAYWIPGDLSPSK